MSEIKKVTFSMRKSNFPIFPAQMGKLSLFQHEAFCYRSSIVLQVITNNYIFILSLGFLLLIADWDYNLNYWLMLRNRANPVPACPDGIGEDSDPDLSRMPMNRHKSEETEFSSPDSRDAPRLHRPINRDQGGKLSRQKNSVYLRSLALAFYMVSPVSSPVFEPRNRAPIR